MIGWLERPDGWLASVAKQLNLPLSAESTTGQGVTAKETDAKFADATTTEKLIRSAYLRTVSREPTTEEQQTAREHIASTENTIEGLRDLMWALLNSQEFLTNH